jgi:hypothetical protein
MWQRLRLSLHVLPRITSLIEPIEDVANVIQVRLKSPAIQFIPMKRSRNWSTIARPYRVRRRSSLGIGIPCCIHKNAALPLPLPHFGRQALRIALGKICSNPARERSDFLKICAAIQGH